MKRLVLAVFLLVGFALNASAQTKKTEVRKETKVQREVTIHIQIFAIEDPQSFKTRLNVVTGDDYQFYLQDKEMFQTMDEIRTQVPTFNTLPDCLNFLSDKGFKLDHMSTIFLNGKNQHSIILSNTLKY